MNVPTSLPLFPLGDVLYPGNKMPLHIFEERYRRLMRDRRDADPIFGVVLTESGLEVGDEPTIHRVGTAATLLGATEFPDGRWAIVIEGTQRFRVLGSSWETSYLVASIEWLDDADVETGSTSDAARLIDSFLAYLRAVGAEARDTVLSGSIETIETVLRETFADDVPGLTYLIAGQLPINTWSRQRILGISSQAGRAREVLSLIRQESNLLDRAGATSAITSHPLSMILPN